MPPELPASPYLRRLADRVPSMLAYWDRELVCRYANRAYEHWFGVSPERLIGTTLRELLGPELFARNEPYILGALRGEEQIFERMVPGPGGTQRHGLAHYIPDRDDQGTVVGFGVQVTEITRLKETEAALQREQALRSEVEAHARELAALLKERTEMLDVLAHEVRQPLNNASAALQSAVGAVGVIGGRGGQAVGRQLARAQVVVGQVMASIDNTLAVMSLLSRPGAVGRLDVDIDTLVAVVVADMPLHERPRIRIDRATTTRTASMDMNLVRLALRNLLVNALRYSPPAAPVVIRITDSDDPLALVIDVNDAGGGIEASLVPRLFERGVRGRHPGTKPGHGLGLYIARRVMELHGGRAEIAANSERGTTMRLVISQ